MSFASRLITAFIGLALLWYFWPFGGNSEVVKTVRPPPTGHEGPLFTTKLPEDAPPKKPAPNKLPEGGAKNAHSNAQGNADGDADGTNVAALTPSAKPKLKAKRFYRVRVLDSSTLEAGGRVIKLEGINGITSEETCKDSAGATWFCGTRARMALTRFIRGRAVVCEVPETAKAKTLTASCTLARKDLSNWMVAQGWAKPAAPAQPKLAQAADRARKKKIGIWR
jgi:endonuclease YncB( thermonuclease family)